MDVSKIYISSLLTTLSLDNLIYAHGFKCCLLAERLSNLYLYPNLAIELHCHWANVGIFPEHIPNQTFDFPFLPQIWPSVSHLSKRNYRPPG